MTVAILCLTVSSAVSPASASPAPHSHPPPSAAATITASAVPSYVTVGSNVQLSLTVSGYNYTACGSGSLNWQLTNGGSFLNPYTATITGNGTFTYVWASQAPTGVWNLTGGLFSSECPAVATASSVAIHVSPPSGGGIALPSWLYEFLSITYNGIATILDEGIAAPIASIIGTTGEAFAQLVYPWGQALYSAGILGPLSLVVGLLVTAMAVYAILDMTGAVKVVLGY